MENLSFEKIIYNVKIFNLIYNVNDKCENVNILLKIRTINKNNECDAEIYDTKGRYFYCYKLCNNYDYYYNLYLNNNFKITYCSFENKYRIHIDGAVFGKDKYGLFIRDSLDSLEKELDSLEKELEIKRTKYNNLKKITDYLINKN